MATAHTTAATRTLTPAERANQRNAVLPGFLGWTLDAFDFFILTLVIDDVARSFGKTRPDIALALTIARDVHGAGWIVDELLERGQ
jgi:SHS family lactate transporter-like MFS transporter